MEKTLLVQVAALGHDLTERMTSDCSIAGLEFHPIDSVFPAVTCTAQATMRTGVLPGDHGMVGNGFYSREFERPFFWEQSSSLVQGDRIWRDFRTEGGSVGQLFWQQSLGRDSDVVLSPAPIHKHHGGMIQDVFSRPRGLYKRICEAVGRSFNLTDYWGPRASRKASDWITAATREVMHDPAPDLLLTYLPHLDYDLQRYGPRSSRANDAFDLTSGYLEHLLEAAEHCGYQVVVFGDYAITPATLPLHPNRMLRNAGLFIPRRVNDMVYADLHSSRAFAVVDHQICHVITEDREAYKKAHDLFASAENIELVLGPEGQNTHGIHHKRSGDLVLQASPECWFAYPWWSEEEKSPDYASHVDIHNKPGYDPAELFWGFWPFSTSQDATRIKGTHGAVNSETRASWATTMEFADEPENIRFISHCLQKRLNRPV